MIKQKSIDTTKANLLMSQLDKFLECAQQHVYRLTNLARSGIHEGLQKIFFESDDWPGWLFSDEWDGDRPLPGKLTIAYEGSVLWTLSYSSSFVPVH